MLTLEKCNTVLKKYGFHLNNENIKILREFLYSMANLQLQNENINNGKTDTL